MALMCASVMSYAIDWSSIEWLGSTDAAYAEKFKVSPADGQNVVNIQNPYGTGLGIYSSFPVALSSCSLEEGTYQIEGSGLLLFVDKITAKETPVTVVDALSNEYQFVVFFVDGTSTAVETVEAKAKAVKFVEDGQLIIIKDGVRYNAAGQQIK